MISKVCGGFFHDWRHLLGQFFHLTDADIFKDIQNTLEGHLGESCLKALDEFEYFFLENLGLK